MPKGKKNGEKGSLEQKKMWERKKLKMAKKKENIRKPTQTDRVEHFVVF